ncbi:MAG TPA: hypothetical protein PLE43_04570 [Alphaproteobacteria bacterium]|jgi:hypothetical protein|nr:hypothetical protein [Micavibrio sp.]HPQ50633.1 hypothetical protein [Alphaproteobacteria bacterium]HRK97737.1 hypothetical protein [Alphaproteobacteria bacterium]
MNRNIGVLIFLSVLGVGLSGCEAVQSIGQSIESINWPKANTANTAESAQQPSMTVNGQTQVVKLPDNCPQLKVLGELSEITQFSTPKKPIADELIAAAKFSTLDATCQVSPNSVTLEISLDFDGILGPVGMKNGASEANYTYPYFLSVITPQGQILSKDVFALSMVYSEGQPAIHKQDRLRQTIPLMVGQDSGQFQIVVGFQLNEDELSYNRMKK